MNKERFTDYLIGTEEISISIDGEKKLKTTINQLQKFILNHINIQTPEGVTDNLEQGNMNAITSNRVYETIGNISQLLNLI